MLRAVSDPLAQTLVADVDGSAVLAAASRVIDSGPRVVAGRYEILGLLGAGGMGNVYRARDLELEELVALKVLRHEISGNPAALEQFRSEVKLARRVTHPNVARVFDIGDEDGAKYLTMELVDGESLGALLERSGRLPVARAVEIAAAVCTGLAAAHGAGVVHRDLKPDNVLLAKDGRVVVTDFGIARAAASADAKVTGTITGTPAYMAPEQVEGKPTDARADIYALGAMLYETLTGEPPWQGNSVLAIAVARLLEAPPDPRAKRPDLPADLAAIVLRCMARRPAERYPSVDDVGLALRALDLRATAPSSPPAAPRPAVASPAVPHPLARHTEVAVLPFRNAGPKDQEHIADGLTEDLIDLLSMAQGLHVRSRGTVMRYRNVERDPREIGRELAVHVVVEGTVRRENGAVRISVRLVSVTDGMQIWHRRFDRPEAEIFAVSDAAARAISEALAATLSAPARCAPDNAEAIDLYLRARLCYRRYFADLGGESTRLFERALALAPDDPRILAGYAMANGRNWTADPEQNDRTRAVAERAVERAPDLAESHVALATVRFHEQREPEAIVALQRALRVQPLNAEAHDLLGRILSETALQDAAQRHLETALRLEPDFHLARTLLVRLHLLRGDRDTADEVLASGQTDAGSRLPALTRMCLWTRDVERAKRVLLEEAGRKDAAWQLSRALLETVAERTPPFLRVPEPAVLISRFAGFLCQIQAECAMCLDDQERALTAVEKADERGVFDVAWTDGCPLLAPLHHNERFVRARAGIAARAQRIADAYVATDAFAEG
jgi:TolB-like protein/Flp pilus assembly protein TadD/predicted Ser/Thr protein kinase